MTEEPVVIDLCCGSGGWVIPNVRFIGFDVENLGYPGELVLQDIRTLDGRRLRRVNPSCFVASPPCTEFSTARWAFNPSLRNYFPDFSIVDACFRIAREAKAPLILENVVGLRRWLGPYKAKFGPYCLWGDVPPLIPQSRMTKGWKESKSKTGRAGPTARARNPVMTSRIPTPLAEAVIRPMLNTPPMRIE